MSLDSTVLGIRSCLCFVMLLIEKLLIGLSELLGLASVAEGLAGPLRVSGRSPPPLCA